VQSFLRELLRPLHRLLIRLHAEPAARLGARLFSLGSFSRLIGFLHFQYQKRRNPLLFQRVILGELTVEACVRSFGYSVAIVKWFMDGGDNTRRLDFPLTRQSVVLDVGGYIGDWSVEIAKRYDPRIHVFEPMPETFKILRHNTENNPRISVYPFGLADGNRMARFSGPEGGSTTFGAGENGVNACLRDIKEVVDELDLGEIDLVKINIEGGEYDLLHRMFETELIPRCRYLMIQFHPWFPDAKRLRRELVGALSATHEVLWSYPFVWESWAHRGLTTVTVASNGEPRPEVGQKRP